jgi:ribosome-associated toxin RatA of RatAB toxin-antitoxin module
MPIIHLTTFIAAPAERVFNLSRHVGLQQQSMAAYNEEAVAGTTTGVLEKEDTVTWKARHVFKTRVLKIKVTQLEKHSLYTYEQVEGDLKWMRNEYYFKPCDNGTILINIFSFETKYGMIGRLINTIYLTNYIKHLLEQQNAVIKQTAETDKWKILL